MLRPIPDNVHEIRAKFSFERGNLQTVNGNAIEWIEKFDYDRFARGKMHRESFPHVWDRTGMYRGPDGGPRLKALALRSWVHKFDLVNGQDVDRKFVRTVRPRYSADFGICMSAFRYMLDSQFKTSQEKPMTDHIPFDLEAAKRGEPIQFRDGQKCTFVAHVPSAYSDQQLIVVTDSGSVIARRVSGLRRGTPDETKDVVMLPKPLVRYVHFVKASHNNEVWTDTGASPISAPNMVSRIRVECEPGRFDD